MFKRLLTGIAGTLMTAAVATAATPPYTPELTVANTMLAAPDFTHIEYLIPVDSAAIADAQALQLVADLLKEADTHLGTRYMRGGKTPKGFDCSGFTSYVYSKFGYSLSPSSRGQFLEGTEVSSDEIKPGDLLFFKGRRSRSVGHVAIAIDADPVTGEVTFIHAAVKGGIRIDRTSMPYYSARFIGARRVIN